MDLVCQLIRGTREAPECFALPKVSDDDIAPGALVYIPGRGACVSLFRGGYCNAFGEYVETGVTFVDRRTNTPSKQVVFGWRADEPLNRFKSRGEACLIHPSPKWTESPTQGGRHYLDLSRPEFPISGWPFLLYDAGDIRCLWGPSEDKSGATDYEFRLTTIEEDDPYICFDKHQRGWNDYAVQSRNKILLGVNIKFA